MNLCHFQLLHMCQVCLFWEIRDNSGNLELLDFKRNLTTGQTRLKINIERQYRLGEGVIGKG